MLQHFQVQSAHPRLLRLGWNFSCFYKQQRIMGHYSAAGKINIHPSLLTAEDKIKLKKHIHELMIFHIYEYR